MSILFHNTMQITEGHAVEFAEAVRSAVAFAEEHGPQQAVQVFIDEERGLAHSFQIYRDSPDVLAHWQLSDPFIEGVMAHCTIASFEAFGDLSDEVRAGLPAGTEGGSTPRPTLIGFCRS